MNGQALENKKPGCNDAVGWRFLGYPVSWRYTDRSAHSFHEVQLEHTRGQASWLMAASDASPPSHPPCAGSGFQTHPRDAQGKASRQLQWRDRTGFSPDFLFSPFLPQKSNRRRATDGRWINSFVNALRVTKYRISVNNETQHQNHRSRLNRNARQNTARRSEPRRFPSPPCVPHRDCGILRSQMTPLAPSPTMASDAPGILRGRSR